MATTKAQQRATNKWMAKTYDSLRIIVKKGKKDIIRAHAEQMGESINAFVGRAIDEAMARDAQKADSRGVGDMEKQGESR